MSGQRYYPGWGARAEELAEWLKTTYEREGYQAQLMNIPGSDEGVGGWVLQIREIYKEGWHETLSTVAGLDTAATLTFRNHRKGLSLEIGGGKWLDKAAVAGVALMTAGLLLLPAGIGAVKQDRLLKDLANDVERYIRTASEEE